MYQKDKTEAKFYVVKKIRLVEFLMRKGHAYIKQQPDRYNPDRCVWIFIRTPELLEDVDEYYTTGYFADNKGHDKYTH